MFALRTVILLWLAPVAFAQPPATPVGVDPVTLQPMSQTVPVIGRVVPLQSGVVAARTAGPVAELAVNIGDHVEPGDIIAKLDQARLQTQKEMQEAELKELQAYKKTAEANEKLAEQELERLQKLRNSAAFTRYDFDKRTQELAVARSSREQAEASIARGEVKLRQAEIELRDSVIRAPYASTVTLRHTSEGAWLSTGDPVVTLISDADLEIEAEVPTERLAGVQPGTQVRLLIGSSEQRATVRAIVPDENPAARTRPVRFVPQFTDLVLGAPLAANQAVTLYLPAGAAAEVLTVSKDAVLRKDAQAIVYVVDGGVAKPRPVQLGEAVGSRFQVLKGLQAGEIVVVRGNERLRPNQPVTYPGEPKVAKADGEES